MGILVRLGILLILVTRDAQDVCVNKAGSCCVDYDGCIG